MHDAFGRRSVLADIESSPDIRAPESSTEIIAQPTTSPSGMGLGPSGATRERVAKYEELAKIGRGGMGEVLLLRDRDLRREIAMKVIRPEYASMPSMQRKFVAEAQATSQLEHPGIPPVHDIGRRSDGGLYFTMKVVRGRTLTQVLHDLVLGVKETRREYTLHRLVSILERICEALD